MNLRLTGGTAQKNRASGFLLQRHAHHAASRLTWVIRWLKRAYRHHAQSRELRNPKESYRFKVQGSRFKVLLHGSAARQRLFGSKRDDGVDARGASRRHV